MPAQKLLLNPIPIDEVQNSISHISSLTFIKCLLPAWFFFFVFIFMIFILSCGSQEDYTRYYTS